MMNQQTSKQHLEIVIAFVAHHQKREIYYVHNQNSKNASKWALALSNVRKLSLTQTKKCELHRAKHLSLEIIESANSAAHVVKSSQKYVFSLPFFLVLSKAQYQVFTLTSQLTFY